MPKLLVTYGNTKFHLHYEISATKGSKKHFSSCHYSLKVLALFNANMCLYLKIITMFFKQLRTHINFLEMYGK